MTRPRQRVSIAEIQNLVSLQLGISEVGEDAQLVSELGAESADLINLVAAVEDKYVVLITEDEIPEIRSVRDLFERARG
ncbi:MAG: phosphopantetheine-binding protein [Acidobacteriota bacterium]